MINIFYLYDMKKLVNTDQADSRNSVTAACCKFDENSSLFLYLDLVIWGIVIFSS